MPAHPWQRTASIALARTAEHRILFPQGKTAGWNRLFPPRRSGQWGCLTWLSAETLYALQNSNFVDKPVVVSAFRREGWLELYQLSGEIQRIASRRFQPMERAWWLAGMRTETFNSGRPDLHLLHLLKGASVEVIAEAFSPDGAQLATGSDGLIRL